MYRIRGLQIATAATLALTMTGEGVTADQARGRSIAERWCSGCHVAAPGQLQGSDTVPTFAQIGKSDKFDEASLAAFLAAPPHSRMPNLSLTRSEIKDLVAYIKAKQP
ncbi:mono/diheme cytochrome c family protein [Mycoplana sp. BE70]|uniref:c-type cytochrome n=1 Tax=Mycoplana sp. BE70 TaxID=2817775 RepID=UPI00285EAA99|nr:c-type cytochrome [Mycoplana sp. BE70]MDR6755389.1 mono/diheme cytochrome c family protein [Mycoplana sp. BE70]